MRTKVTLVLVFLNVALFFFIFKFERAWRTQDQLLEARRRVLGPEAADIRTLEIDAPGGAFRLERKGETWWLTKPLEWPANVHAVSSILSALILLEHETSFSTKDLGKNNNPTLDTYGLEKPKLRVTFTSGENGAPVALRLGDITKAGTLYLLSPDGGLIHVVGRALADSVSLPLAQLRDDTLFSIHVFEARSLAIRAAAGAPVRIRLDSDRTHWSFETPIIARASKAALDLAISDLNTLRAVNFNPPAPSGALPSAAFALRVTLDGNNRHETLFIGDPLGPTAIPAGTATAPDVEYYAQLAGAESADKPRPALFTVTLPAKLLETLRNAQETLREKRLLEFDAAAVTAVTLTAPNQPPLTLQRLEAPANAMTEAAWQIVRRGDGSQGPQTLAADRAAVKKLLARLAALAARDTQGFVSDAPSAADLENWGFNRPEREITLTFGPSKPPLTPLTLQLGTDSAGKVYARVANVANGSSIYAVDADLRQNGEFPFAPRAWRDHQVRDPLPAVAHITALKLTDLATGAAVLDVALDADGKPKPDTPNAKAVEAVALQLRSLRAKAFVQDGFTERVFLAGEERAWKYRLDATVSLPGGAGGEQTSVSTLWLTERGGGAQQLAGVKEADAVFEIEQPFLDALWALTYRDPGPPPPAAPPAKSP